MKEHLFKKISVRTGLSVIEIMNVFTVTASIIRQELYDKRACLIPMIGRFFIKDVPRRKMKLTDFKTKTYRIAVLPPRSLVKFEIDKSLRSITKVEPESVGTMSLPNKKHGQPINIE